MNIIVQDRDLLEDVRDQRAADGLDLHDEVWEGVYLIMPYPDDEHQDLATSFSAVAIEAVGRPLQAKVRAGVNVSDRVVDWRRNFRIPDVAVFLLETAAVCHGAFWFGGPDFGLEIISPDDRTRDKLNFYEKIGTRELLLIDRDPWALELHRLRDGGFVEVGRSTLDDPTILNSEVLPLSFQLATGETRPVIVVAHLEDDRRWTV